MPFRSLALLLALLVLPALPVHAQTDGLLQLDDDLTTFLERQHTAGRLPSAFLTHQPLSAYEAHRYLDSLSLRADELAPTDRMLLRRFRSEATGPRARWLHERSPWLYANGRDVFSVSADDYAVQINPLLYLTLGRASTSVAGEEQTVTTWQNTRGVRASGRIGKHLFFETRLEENQRRRPLPAYGLATAPRLGNTKFYPESQVHDYFLATGVVGWHDEHFEIRFGRDRNQWGPGRTSLVLSDYPTVYDQLQLRTRFWRLQYVNLFAAFTDLTSFSGTHLSNQVLPRRYGAMHHLSLHLPGRLTIGFFESVIFAPDTLGVRGDGFDVSYLNPVIFYRSVEHDRGSPDNVLLGFDASWIAYPGARLYTQLLLDELVIDRIGKSDWRNKWGWVAGVALADLVPGLSLQAEYARLRPFLYSHRYPPNAYLHFDDLLGHPAGPNAEDVALFIDYRPRPAVRLALNAAYTRRGRNTDEQNYGADPRRSYNSRTSDEAPLLQGVRQEMLFVEAVGGYELLPGLYLEAALRMESIDDAENGMTRYVDPFLMVRWGLPFKSARY